MTPADLVAEVRHRSVPGHQVDSRLIPTICECGWTGKPQTLQGEANQIMRQHRATRKHAAAMAGDLKTCVVCEVEETTEGTCHGCKAAMKDPDFDIDDRVITRRRNGVVTWRKP